MTSKASSSTSLLRTSTPRSLKIEVYMAQPKGLEDGSGRACRLHRALYGLRGSAKWWFSTITPVLKTQDFEPLTNDACVFNNKRTGALLLYVDDMLIAAATKEEIKKLKAKLSAEWT